jgi:hypothetical protein
MGIVLVAFVAARISVAPPEATMISTLRRTSSAASLGKRSLFPSAYWYFYVAKLMQRQPNWLGTGGVSSRIDRRYIPYPRNFLRLLRIGEDCNSKQHHYKQD